MRRTAIFAALAVLILLSGVVLANGVAVVVDRYVVGGGGGYVEADPYALSGTVGQAVVGVASSVGDYELCSGFWCGQVVEYKIYLPLLLRNG